ncbi:MAG: tetratricopeptide repeat protein [archaeon]
MSKTDLYYKAQYLWKEGMKAEKEKKVGLAIELYKEAIKLGKDVGWENVLSKYKKYLANAYERAGKLNESLKHHKEAGTLGKNRKYIKLLKIYFEMGELEKLETLYKKWANKIGLKKGKEHLFLGRLYYFEGEIRKMLREYEKKIEKVDNSYLFSLDITYQDDLKEGTLNEDLREAFEDVDQPLVVNWELSKVENDYVIQTKNGDSKKYRIKKSGDELRVYQLFGGTLKEEYLFNTKADISEDLKEGKISDSIKKELDEKGNKLSGEAFLKDEKESSKWAIFDKEDKYYVYNKENDLDVTVTKPAEKDYSYYDFSKRDLFIVLEGIKKISENLEKIDSVKKQYPRLIKIICNEFEDLDTALSISEDKDHTMLKNYCRRSLSSKLIDDKNANLEYSEEKLEQILESYQTRKDRLEIEQKARKSENKLKNLVSKGYYKRALNIVRRNNRKKQNLIHQEKNMELNLIYLSDDKIDGAFVLQGYSSLIEDQTDFFLEEFREGIEKLIDEKLENFRKEHGIKILDQVVESNEISSYTKYGWRNEGSKLEFYDFAHNDYFKGILEDIIGDIENEYRKKNDLPKIGEE